MKVVSDLLAVILFFLVWFITKDILTATKVAVVAGVAQAIFIWFKYKKLNTMQLVSLSLIVVFGSLTVYLEDAFFIKMKPTLLYWVIALIIMGGLLLKKNTIKMLIGKEITLPDTVWRNIALMWMVFFIILGALNLWVALHFEGDEIWMYFKTFGVVGLMLCFFVVQGVYMSKYLPKEEV